MSLFSRPKPKPDLFEQQCAYEREGAAARMKDQPISDCPYPPAEQHRINTGRLFWEEGWRRAEAERRIIRDGYKVFFASTAEHGGHGSWAAYEEAWNAAPMISAEKAMEQGYWKPRFISPNDFSAIRKSSQ